MQRHRDDTCRRRRDGVVRLGGHALPHVQPFCRAKRLFDGVLDYLDGDITGIKTVTFEVKGENAYGYLKSEKGVHRLVRISPFNAAGKRQTSFASCDVVPDIEDEIDIEIADEELKICE